MGEYASYAGQQVKIGTCENMYYLRADQAESVRALEGNVDPVADRELIRFRFPWPDEDGSEPGTYHEHDRRLLLPGLTPPAELEGEHYSYRETGHEHVYLSQQKYRADGTLMAIVECACGLKWRLETLADAAPALESLCDVAERRGAADGRFLLEVARRLLAGYSVSAGQLSLPS